MCDFYGMKVNVGYNINTIDLCDTNLIFHYFGVTCRYNSFLSDGSICINCIWNYRWQCGCSCSHNIFYIIIYQMQSVLKKCNLGFYILDWKVMQSHPWKYQMQKKYYCIHRNFVSSFQPSCLGGESLKLSLSLMRIFMTVINCEFKKTFLEKSFRAYYWCLSL